LIALAASEDGSLADAAANYAVAHMTQAQALAAVSARSRGLEPVWRPAISSLVLTNFASSTTAPTAANLASFTQPLNTNASIAARLAKPANTSTQLTGDNWFYYAKRFGIFLATVLHAPALPDASDFLDAELERAPTAVGAYLRLARNESDAGNLGESIAQYNHALELAPNNPAVRDEFAVVLYRANRHDWS
jgi:tetratricopeptide (TPR) repeat protein